MREVVAVVPDALLGDCLPLHRRNGIGRRTRRTSPVVWPGRGAWVDEAEEARHAGA